MLDTDDYISTEYFNQYLNLNFKHNLLLFEITWPHLDLEKQIPTNTSYLQLNLQGRGIPAVAYGILTASTTAIILPFLCMLT